MRRKRPASSITSTPSDFAFSSLLPASSPATRNVVDFDTEPVTRPPAASIIAVAFVLLNVGRVPVITTVLPLSGPPATTARGSVKFSPRLLSFSTSARPAGSEKYATTPLAIVAPIPRTLRMSSADAATIASSVPKCCASSCAAIEPTCLIPSALSSWERGCDLEAWIAAMSVSVPLSA